MHSESNSEYYYLKRDEPIWIGPLSRTQLVEAAERDLLAGSTWIHWAHCPFQPGIKYHQIDYQYFVAHPDVIAGAPANPICRFRPIA